MIVLGIALGIVGAGLVCWLLFNLAVYALPVFIGLTAGLAASRTGAGALGGLVVGLLAGAAALALGQVAFRTARTPLVRGLIALVFAAPAAFAGYHAVLGLTRLGVPGAAWREALAVIGAVVIGSVAWARIAAFAPAHSPP